MNTLLSTYLTTMLVDLRQVFSPFKNSFYNITILKHLCMGTFNHFFLCAKMHYVVTIHIGISSFKIEKSLDNVS